MLASSGVMNFSPSGWCVLSITPLICFTSHLPAIDFNETVAKVVHVPRRTVTVVIPARRFIFPAPPVKPRGWVQDEFRLSVPDIRRVAFDRRHDRAGKFGTWI